MNVLNEIVLANAPGKRALTSRHRVQAVTERQDRNADDRV
jgi:hypothetical protein